MATSKCLLQRTTLRRAIRHRFSSRLSSDLNAEGGFARASWRDTTSRCSRPSRVPGRGRTHTAAHPPGPSTAGYTDRAWPNLGSCPGGAQSNSRRSILQLSIASAESACADWMEPQVRGNIRPLRRRIVRTGSLFRADDTRVCVLDPLNALRCLSETVPVAAYPVRHAAPAPAPAGRAKVGKRPGPSSRFRPRARAGSFYSAVPRHRAPHPA